MNDGIFFGILIIPQGVLADEFHEDILVVQFPDARIELKEQVGGAVIAQEQAAVSVPDKVLVVSELKIEIFPGIEIDGGPVVEIIEARRLEELVISRARN